MNFFIFSYEKLHCDKIRPAVQRTRKIEMNKL